MGLLDLLIIGQRHRHGEVAMAELRFRRPNKNLLYPFLVFAKSWFITFLLCIFLAAHTLDARYQFGLRFTWDLMSASPRIVIGSRAFASAPEPLSSVDTVRLANCLSSCHAIVAEGKENVSPKPTHQVSQPDLLGAYFPQWLLRQYKR